MVRIRDVARLAQVSPATVSRVLNGRAVREDLAAAVHAAVAELGYVPHAAARSLRRGHSDVIALIVPDVENPFFTTIARAVEDAAGVAGYSVVLCNTDDRPDKETRYLHIALRENMAGVIIAPATPHPDLSPLLARGRAVVVIDRETHHAVDHIMFDNLELGSRATQTLLERGHTKIVCITGPKTTSTAVERAQGWRQALTAAGHPPDDPQLVYANFRVEGGRAAARELLRLGALRPADAPRGAGATAILATNNLVGVGVLQELAVNEVEVEVAVIGDLPYATSDLSGVAITNLAPGDLGRAAIEHLLRRISAPGAPVQFVRRGFQDGRTGTVPGVDLHEKSISETLR